MDPSPKEARGLGGGQGGRRWHRLRSANIPVAPIRPLQPLVSSSIAGNGTLHHRTTRWCRRQSGSSRCPDLGELIMECADGGWRFQIWCQLLPSWPPTASSIRSGIPAMGCCRQCRRSGEGRRGRIWVWVIRLPRGSLVLARLSYVHGIQVSNIYLWFVSCVLP